MNGRADSTRADPAAGAAPPGSIRSMEGETFSTWDRNCRPLDGAAWRVLWLLHWNSHPCAVNGPISRF